MTKFGKIFIGTLIAGLTIVGINAVIGTPIPYTAELNDRLAALEAGTGFSAGAIDTTDILDSTIASADIAADTIAAADIATSAVATAEILDGTILEADIGAQTAEGLHIKRIARVTYDVATDLGTIGARGLGVTLPATALITRSYIYIVTQFTDAGAGTVALHCEDANNIKTATDITGTAAGGFIEGQSTGTAASMVGGIAAACEITATVATADQTAGKLLLFVEYNDYE